LPNEKANQAVRDIDPKGRKGILSLLGGKIREKDKGLPKFKGAGFSSQPTGLVWAFDLLKRLKQFWDKLLSDANCCDRFPIE
jgi:hypothetical protein